MLFYGIAAGAEALAALGGWNEALYRTWYLTGAVWTAGWLGLGTAFLLGRTRFGYSFALCLLLAGVFTLPHPAPVRLPGRRHGRRSCTSSPRSSSPWPWRSRRTSRTSAGRSSRRRPWSARRSSRRVLMLTVTLAAPGYALDPATGHAGRRPVPGHAPAADAVPEHHRRLRAGPRRDLLHVRVHAEAARPALLARSEPARRRVPVQPADRAGGDRRQPRRVPAGRHPRARHRPASTAGCRRRSSSPSARSSRRSPIRSTGSARPSCSSSGKFLGVLFLFAGFLVSIEVFREIRIPFTGIRWAPRRNARRERRGDDAGRMPSGRRPRSPRRPGAPPLTRVARAAERACGPTMTRCPAPPSADRRASVAPIVAADRAPAAARLRHRHRAAALFGMLGPLSRFAYDAGMEPAGFVAWRALIGLLATGAYVAWRVRRGATRLIRLRRPAGRARGRCCCSPRSWASR